MQTTRTILLVYTLTTWALLSVSPPVHASEADRELFHRYLSYIEPYAEVPLDTLLEKTALFFLGSPYVAHTLEVTEEETLVVNLREFDCVTFVETVIALTHTVRSGNPTFNEYRRQLQKLRYRDGEIKGYPSRLHYTSDWVYNNEQNGLLQNISARLGGKREGKEINFMSSHRDAYRQLKSDDAVLGEIRAIEKEINHRNGFIYVPKEKIQGVVAQIPHMAMLGFTTRINGLDITHTGFAFWEGDRLTFIHASSVRKEVVIDRQTLSDYCAAQSSCTGILVARVL